MFTFETLVNKMYQMIGFLKRLLGKKEKGESLSSGAHKGVVEQGKPSPAITAQPVKPVGDQVAALSDDVVDKTNIIISLQSIISGLPDELKKEVLINPGRDVMVKFSQGRILPQLSTGVVKITFRELKNASPAGIFSSNTSLDNEFVYLPLDKVISQALPLLKRKPTQRAVEISPEIPDIFGEKGKIIAEEKVSVREERKEPVVVEKKPEAPQPESVAEPIKATGIKEEEVVEPQPVIKQQEQIISMPEQSEVVAPQVDIENSISVDIKSLSVGWDENIKKKFEEFKILESKVFIPINELEPQMKRGKVEFSWEKLRQWVVPRPLTEIIERETVLELPLSVIAPLFLSRVRKPKVQKKITVDEELPDLFTQSGAESKVEAEKPAAVLSLKPSQEKQATEAPPSPEPSKTEEKQVVKTPLVIKPDVIKLKPEPKMPQQEMVSAQPSVKPDELKPAVGKAEISKPKSLGELFNKPDKPVWSPNEIVQNTLTLPGVSGVMIVLKDGLPVVAKLPAGIKPEALAGFVPEMFSKLEHYVHDLNFGQINNISITCDDFKLYACKSGNIYLVVVGEKDKPALSPDILQFIADEFSRPLKR